MRILGPILLYLGVFSFCIALVAVPSCKPGVNCSDPANALSTSCVAQVAVDCGGGSVQGAITQYGPLIEQIFQSARNPDGTINWGAIEMPLAQAALQYGGCVVAQEFDNLMNGLFGGGSGSGSAVAATPAPAPLSSTGAKDAFAKVKAQAFPGKTFKVKSGQTL